MPTLREKITNLEFTSNAGLRTALFWKNAIAKHGEQTAEAFYKSLGLNHIESKGKVEWEGLTLSREPTEAEKLCVKGIAGAQESSKEKIGTILLKLRVDLISDGLKGIQKLEPANYHELTLQASTQSRESLRDRLIKTYKQGRLLVVRELGRLPKGFIHDEGCNEKFLKNEPRGYQCQCEWKQDDEDEFDELDELTDLTDARVANDVQSRITAAAARFAMMGLVGTALMTAIQKEMADGSVSYIDRASTGLANRVINIGRGDEARRRSDEWERVTYSALLDANCCENCAAEDGKESADGEDLEPVPNVNCLGADLCRCFWVYVAEGNM